MSNEKNSSNPILKENGTIIIPYGNELEFEFHDTFKTDRYGNIYNGHSTFNLKGGEKLRINTDILKSRSDSSFSNR